MNNNNHNAHIFTRSRKNIDQGVWLTLAIISVLSLGLLSYKVASNVQCSPFEIGLKGYTAGKTNSYYVGEKITFSAKMKDGGDISWDFGDHSKATGSEVSHTYTTEGTFIVSATANGKCVESVNLDIRALHQPITLSTTVQNPISGPEAIHAQESANFSASSDASSYEWTVLNAPDFPVQKSQTATYMFLSPGTRILELKLDNDPKKVFRKTIQVLPALVSNDKPLVNDNMVQPIVPAPSLAKEEKKDDAEAEKPKTTIIPNEEFVTMFNQVTEGKKDLASFNQYLCSGGQTKVLANGTDWETLISFYQKINERKKYDIKSVEAVRDPETNCVTVLKVKYKKRTLGIF